MAQQISRLSTGRTAPCTGAVKIKFLSGISSNPLVMHVVEERGPFDVLHSPQTVALVPPVAFTPGELVGITALSSCGQPLGSVGVNLGFGQRIVVVAGDVKGDFAVSPSDVQVGIVSIAGQTSTALHLLGNRFFVRLDATDPRTGRTTTGIGVKLADGAGYFSLPDFTGDPNFPEVMVKMVDATSAPPPFGGSFWVFQSPLTDVQYRLEVRDTVAGQGLGYRLYTNSPTSGDQLCGTADTDAFPK